MQGQISDDEIENRFQYHPPKPGQPEEYALVRMKFLEMARFLKDRLPGSRETNLALTHLEQSMFCANASIARRS